MRRAQIAIGLTVFLVFALGTPLASASEYAQISGRIVDAATGKGPTTRTVLFSTNAVNGGLGASEEGSYTAAVWAGRSSSFRVWETPSQPVMYHAAWYGGAADPQFAESFVAGPEGLSGIDIVLNRLGDGTIAGSITDEAGIPVRNAWAVAYEWCPALNVWDPVESLAVSGRQGEFMISRLAPGTYKVGIAADLSRDIRWYVGGASLETATCFSVSNGDVTGPAMATLQGYRYVEPLVLRIPPSHPIAYTLDYGGYRGQMIDAATGARVLGKVDSSWFTGYNGFVNEYGNFNSGGYVDSWATLVASASGYRSGVWFGHDDCEHADLAFLAGSDSWGHTFVMNRPGTSSISGRMVNLAGQPVEGRRVVPYVWAPKLGIWDVVESDCFTDAEGRFDLSNLAAGRYRLAACWPDQTTTAYWSTSTTGSPDEFEVNDGEALGDIEVAMDPNHRCVTRLAGRDRYATAVAATKAAFPNGAERVVIVTGANWPDALAAAGLAGSSNGAVLPVQRDCVPEVIMEELERLDPTHIDVVGGVAAVSQEVIWQLNGLPGQPYTERISRGLNRYATARSLGMGTIGWMGASYDGVAYVATGRNYPDALAVAPLSYSKGRPLYLLGAEDGTTIADMKARGVKSVTIAGGTAAITAAQEAQLVSAFGRGNVTRVYGSDRFSTAVAIANFGVSSTDLQWDGVAIATGYNYSDALAGGVLAARKGSVLVLTGRDSTPLATAKPLHDNRLRIESVTILGGDAAISSDGRGAIARALQ